MLTKIDEQAIATPWTDMSLLLQRDMYVCANVCMDKTDGSWISEFKGVLLKMKLWTSM